MTIEGGKSRLLAQLAGGATGTAPTALCALDVRSRVELIRALED